MKQHPNPGQMTDQLRLLTERITALEEGCIIQTVTKEISSAELLASGTVPILIVPSPGSGKAIAAVSFWFDFKFGTTPYTNIGSASLRLHYAGSASHYITQIGDIITKSENYFASGFGAQESVGAQARSEIEDKDLSLINEDPTNYSDGDGTAVIGVMYSIVDLS